MNPQELKAILSSGLLSFPVTDFDAQGDFNRAGYVKRLEWLGPYGARRCSLPAAPVSSSRWSHASTARSSRPPSIPAPAPYRSSPASVVPPGWPFRWLRRPSAWAKGLLLLPHYLTEASQEGVAAHVEQVCKSVNIGVVVYNRNVCRLTATHLEQLAERCPNLIGYKDGLGDIELMVSIRRRLGDRFSYLGGLPTAEVYAAAYKALGVPVYSSAVFNFIPKTAMDFYQAIAREDHETVGKLIDDFFLPYLEIRNRCKGYAVSIVKAGARISGFDAGPVRAPLTELKPDEYQRLAVLIEQQGAQ